jgi:opacity protein-like surface antigen
MDMEDHVGRTIKFSIIALLMGVIVSSFAASAGNLGLKTVEGRVSYIGLSENDAEGTFGFNVTSYLGKISESFGLEADIGYWSSSWDQEMMGTKVEASLSDISFGCNARYDFSGEGSTKMYGFGGLGFHMMKAEATASYGGITSSADETSTEIGFTFGAAAEFGSGDGMVPVARIGYTAVSDGNYFFIGGGVSFPMGGGEN